MNITQPTEFQQILLQCLKLNVTVYFVFSSLRATMQKQFRKK
jgi:hypothetical protein